MANDLVASARNTERRESCSSCGAEFSGAPKAGLFGFRSIPCSACGKRVWYPLSTGLRIFYWVVVALGAVGAILLLGSGVAIVPGGGSLVAAIVLIVDAKFRRSFVTATTIAALITGLTVAGVLVALFAAGLGSAYATEVVDRPAQVVSKIDGIAFAYGDRICGGGADYVTCAYQHVTMYNSLCTNPNTFVDLDLVPEAVNTCERLRVFAEDVLARSGECGYGCTTTASADGLWGWAYLHPVPVKVDMRVDEVVHEEHCWFSLGPIQLGYCPKEPQ